MARILQLRRGSTADMVAYTGAEGEVVVDLEQKTLRVHDGILQGGYPLMSDVAHDVHEVEMQTIKTKQGDIDTRLLAAESNQTNFDTRINTLETTEFWKTAADSYYINTTDGYTKTEVDQEITTKVSALDSSLGAIYAPISTTYTKTEVDNKIGSLENSVTAGVHGAVSVTEDANTLTFDFGVKA